MSDAIKHQPQNFDKGLMRSSQILTRTFNKQYGDANDLDLLVNPVKSDFIPKQRVNTEPHQIAHTHEAEKPKELSNATPYLLLIALCIDGFFEGIALGVQTKWTKLLFVAFVIILNKICIAFGLGISFKKAGVEMVTFIRFIILFSMFCPFGVVLGYFITPNDLLRGIMLGVASGTFIYVSASVVIVEEFAITQYRWSKYGCFLFGGILTAVITILGDINII